MYCASRFIDDSAVIDDSNTIDKISNRGGAVKRKKFSARSVYANPTITIVFDSFIASIYPCNPFGKIVTLRELGSLCIFGLVAGVVDRGRRIRHRFGFKLAIGT